MAARVTLGLEGVARDLLEDCGGQERPALRQGAIGDGFAGKLFHMLGERASFGHDVEDQALDHLDRGDERGTTRARAVAPQDGVDEGPGDQPVEHRLVSTDGNDRLVSHPNGNTQLSIFVQCLSCGIVIRYASSCPNS